MSRLALAVFALVLTALRPAVAAPDDTLQKRVEAGDVIRFGGGIAPVRLSVEALMRLFNDPGLSVAVVSHFRIAWAKGYGVVAVGSREPVTTGTLFQAGSISKPVTAIAAMALVQSGALNLDEDVNVKLRSWHLPEDGLASGNRVTLRRILSHTAGTTVHGFDGYDIGTPVPTLAQILDGLPPAINAPVRVDLPPGTKWRYSGGAAEIEQQLLQDVTGEPFPKLLHDLVFTKIGMLHSTFEQPLPQSRSSSAAHGTYYDGTPVIGGWKVMPQMAAAGLWTTPSDLALCAIEIARAAHGDSNRVLDRASAALMLTPQVNQVGEVALGNGDHPDRMGLGFFLGDASRPDLFGHIGDDPGFQAMLAMYADTGAGAVVLGNSENTIVLGDYLFEQIARAYRWNNFVLSDRYRVGVGDALALVALRQGVGAALSAYDALKHHPTMNGPRYPLTENALIHLTYALHHHGRKEEALMVALIEVRDYPNYWNAYDTLGEMYAHAGDKVRAVAAYKKALQLNPQSASSKAALEQLEKGG